MFQTTKTERRLAGYVLAFGAGNHAAALSTSATSSRAQPNERKKGLLFAIVKSGVTRNSFPQDLCMPAMVHDYVLGGGKRG